LESPTDDDAINEEVEGRLDNLFGDEDTAADILEDSHESDDSPLRELKTIVLSIDWEITDEVMTNFVKQIAVLKDRLKDDKIIIVFLQLLGSLGEYIRINKGKSHPGAFKILTSLFNELDKIVQSKDLTESEKKKILSAQLTKYKTLKEQLIKAKPKKEENLKEQLIKAKPKKEEKEPEISPVKKTIEPVDLNDLATAISEIKQLLLRINLLAFA
jgi:hypothetical protein